MRMSSETKSISRRVWGGKNKHPHVNETAFKTNVMSRVKELNLNEFSEVSFSAINL